MRAPLLRRSVVGFALVGLLAACGGGGSVSAVANQGFVSGDGTVRTVPAAQRSAPVEVRGPTLTGGALDSRDYRGQVVVVNVWASWCAPCIAEAPGLQKVWDRFRDKGVQFVGINVRDNRAAALAHEKRFAVTYPSIVDPDGKVLLGLRGTLSPKAVPSTLVLDREGRVAVRVLSQLDESTLAGLVTDVLAEGASS